MPKLRDAGLLQPGTLSPQQATADPCLCRRHSNTQRQVWLSLIHTHTHTYVCMCMYFHIFFIYSSISGHLGCFHILAIINNAALNIGVHTHLFELVFCFIKICRSGIAGSLSFPGGSDSKESAYNAGDLSSFPGSGRSPGGGNGYPL